MTRGYDAGPSPEYEKALQDLAGRHGPEAVAESLMAGPRADIQCPRCLASWRPRQETVEDMGIVVSRRLVCRSCGYVMQVEYTPEYLALMGTEGC